MRHIVLLLFLTAVLIGCGGSEANTMPTLVPTAEFGSNSNSPRGDVTDEPAVPPTWTPASGTVEGHIFDLSSNANPESIATQAIHTVQVGETLGELAERYGVSLEAIVQINGIDNPDIIEVGTELIIPGAEQLD